MKGTQKVISFRDLQSGQIELRIMKSTHTGNYTFIKNDVIKCSKLKWEA